jgi:hypothetical protein
MLHQAATTIDTTILSSHADFREISCILIPRPLHPNQYLLELGGFLSPGWTGRLTAGLAEQHIAILTGEAEKISSYAWQSTLLLKAAPSVDPDAIDFVALATTEVNRHGSGAPLVLRDFNLDFGNRHQDSLYLEIRGVDRLGFLGDLLDFFSMRCLFPVKMKVETLGDSAVDRFWLRGMGGSVPSDAIATGLKESLARLIL